MGGGAGGDGGQPQVGLGQPAVDKSNASINTGKVTSQGEGAVQAPAPSPSSGPREGRTRVLSDLAAAQTASNQNVVEPTEDYISPLDHVRSNTSPGLVLDPDKVLCRFELGGKCKDATCPFQHCNPNR